jgi:general secretion pathway protein D
LVTGTLGRARDESEITLRSAVALTAGYFPKVVTSFVPARSTLSRRGLRLALMATASLILSACGTAYLEQSKDERQDAADAVRSLELQPKFPQAVHDNNVSTPPPSGFSFFGSTTPATAPESARAAEETRPLVDEKDGFTLNFENSPVANVAKVILGDGLHVGYVIDPRAQGTITLSSGRPIAKRDMLFVLESALRANNLLLVRDGPGYRIVAAGEGSVGAVDRSGGADAAEPGYGLTVIPLRYISASTLTRLLDGFAARPGAIRTDPSGRMVMVMGTGMERQSALETVRGFDVDWMRGQSVGMYPVRNSDPEPIVSELEKIMDSGEGGLGQGLVKFLPIARQNAVLVVAAKPDLLRIAAKWIERLDSSSTGGAGVKVYKVRHGDAKQIAELLNDIFLRGAGAADAASSEIAPTSGRSALSVTQRLTGGAPSATSGQGGLTGGSNTGAGTGVSNGSSPAGAIATGQGVATSPFGGIATAALGNAFASAAGANGAVLPGVRITADTANNTVLIYASAENYRVIERALNQLDRPRMQVAIDVTIAEVTLNDQLNYGVQFYLSNRAGSIVNSAAGTPTASANAPPGFNVFVGNSATPQAIINALHALTDVKILSNPSLVVVDNQEATLEVGDQVPISTGSATVLSANNAVVNTIDYQNTGIILHVLPRVSPDSSVLLDIEQEISSVPENNTNLTPTISERKVKSEISVNNGQMVLLAGLVSDAQTKSRSGVPILDQLPIVGGAFGTTGKSTARTELIILIRPQIIRNGVDASMVAEQLRAKMRSGKIDAVALPGALNVLSRAPQ